MAMTWCFRVRADIRETSKLEFPDVEWLIEDRGPDRQVKLVSRTLDASGNPVPLSEARSVVLRGSGYGTEEEATAAGQVWRSRLVRAFVTIGMGADFGDRTPYGGVLTTTGLAAFSPPGARALNDVHGLMVFECDPTPIFVTVNPFTVTVSTPHQRLVDAMTNAIENGGLSEENQVTYDLFAASFGQRSADARFALLMMALESLIDPAPRPEESRRHVESPIASTRSSGLPKSEIDSIKGTLSWQLNESIGQAGRRLARTLEPKRYKDQTPAAFFTGCYEIRSRLMHGHHPLPTINEIGEWAAPLQEFIADLLSQQDVTAQESGTEFDNARPRMRFARIIRYIFRRI